MTRRSIPSDTSADAHAVQSEVYRRMGGRKRLGIMFRLNGMVRDLAMSGIRARHPDYTNAQVRLAYARLQLGDADVRAAWPDHELLEP
jgi:hypothetical protein